MLCEEQQQQQQFGTPPLAAPPLIGSFLWHSLKQAAGN